MSDESDPMEVKKPKVGLDRSKTGRAKGTPNKTTALLKDAILKAAENAGNRVGEEGLVSYLERQASENPGPFMALLGKVMPMQVTGENGGDIRITSIIRKVVNART